MKLNASREKTIIVSRSCTMHPHSPPLTIGKKWLKEFNHLVTFGVTFDSKMSTVSRAASQKLGILRKSWRVFHDRSHLRKCFQGFVLPVVYAVCCRRSGVTQCTRLMVLYLDRMCQCGLHAVPWSHIGILMRRFTAEPRSTTGHLFPLSVTLE